jgi:hypothetical protein
MAVTRVQVIQKNVDLLVERITDTKLRQAAESVKSELQNILQDETEGTGELARSVQVHRGTQRGKPILRILTAPHGIFLFRGTKAPYGNIPPSGESRGRFEFWAGAHGFNPRRLARIIALGKSRGQVYSDRSNMLIRALRNGFKI